MSRSGTGFPLWATVGFWLGFAFGMGAGYALANWWYLGARPDRLFVSCILAGTCAVGGAVVGGIRDVLAFLNRRFPSHDSAEVDYRDQPFDGLPPAPPLAR